MASDASSQSSYSTGADSSVASSADARALNDLQRNEDGIADDLTEQNRSVEDAVFASLYTLSKNRRTTDWRWTAARVVLEFLQMFRVVFNTVFIWKIDTNLWIWKAFYWVLFRLVVLPEGYSAYVTVFYLLSAIVLLALGLTVWIAVVLKKDENGGVWIRRLVWVLQMAGLIIFSVFWVAILDYFAFMFDCEWTSFNTAKGAYHVYFPEQSCLAMPHVVHMICAIVMVLVFIFATLCMSISDCTLNPLTRDHLASPVAITNLKTMALKMVMVIVSSSLVVLGRAQAVVMLICSAIITYFLLRSLPFYVMFINATWVGLWTGITFTTVILVFLEYSMDNFDSPISDAAVMHRHEMTMAVLYGIFGAVLLGAGVAYLVFRWRRKPLKKLAEAQKAADTSTNLRDVYRFTDPIQAEFLLRAMRKWDEDGVPDPEAAAFAEFVLKVAMARLPNSPYILTLLANFVIETRRDGQAARTQLQLAAKANPTLLDRYFIYVALETSKKLKSEGDGLDLMGYVEFQRSYRACVRAHKTALQAQRQFWHCLLRDNVSFRDLQLCFEHMEKAEHIATGVYRRVMDRFPANGKLLKIYGRFLEFVRNDPWSASRFYSEAMKQGTSESLLSLAGSSTEADSTSRLSQLLGSVDEKNDGIVIINAAGIIMMINGAGCRMLGYDKGELDGKNVSTIMPQPFSSRHNSFLQRYVNTGEARIMGTLRSVVALHKDRTVFPVNMVVQRLCGVASDAIFMSVMRATASSDPGIVKVWVTTNGVVLCAEERVRDWFGLNGREMVGRSISSLSTDIEGFDSFIAQVSSMTVQQAAASNVKLRTRMLHKYLSPVDAEVTVEMGGSQEHVILVLVMRCTSDCLALLVTDAKGRISFATSQLAQMIGYNPRTLTDGMNMSALLPPPYAQIHGGFLKDLSAKPSPSSCRAGAVVHFQHANGSKVPVTLQLSQHDDGDHMQHVVKVQPASELQLLNQQRIELTLNHKGRVLGVNEGANRSIFGLDPQDLVGKSVASFINVFGQWRTKFGSEDSLLTTLAMRVMQNHEVIVRVGMHTPFSDAEIAQRYSSTSGSGAAAGHEQHAAAAGDTAAAASGDGGQHGTKPSGSGGTAGNMLLTALKSRTKERPAVMTLAMVHASDEEGGGSAAAAIAAMGGGEAALLAGDAAGAAVDAIPLLKLCLWRADGLTSHVELDSKLGVSRADGFAGLIFGLNTAALLHKSYKKLVGLPPSTTAADLLSGSGKKSMLKSGAAWKMGQPRTVDVTNMDGATMKLQMQAVSKDGRSASRLLVLVRLLEASCGSLAPLLALQADTNNTLKKDMLANAHNSDSESDAGDGDEGAQQPQRRGDSPELHDRLDSRLRTEQWLSSSFKKGEGRKGEPDGDEEEEGAAAERHPAAGPGAASGKRVPHSPRGKQGSVAGPASGKGKSHFADDPDVEQEDRHAAAGHRSGHGGHGYVEVHIPPRGGAGAGGFKAGGKPGFGDAGDGYSDASGASKSAGDDAGSEVNGGGSVASSSQASGSEALDAASAAVSGAEEDELVADWRRAKRLKKLNRMLTSSMAQQAAERYKKHTYLLTALITIVHVVCFVVLVTQINARYETAKDVNDMAQATERSQMIAMRANFIQRCGEAVNLHLDVCDPHHIEGYIVKMQDNYHVLNAIHHNLFLGTTTLRQFRDQRLVDKWTYMPMEEKMWYLQTTAGMDQVIDGNSTLWEMGNKLLQAALETRFHAADLKDALLNTTYYQYISNNALTSIFHGYVWSLDVFVDFAWQELGTLNNVLVVLLVIEALVIQCTSMGYEFTLLKASCSEAMKRCSAFLALPSATVRSMASRQIMVDDDDKSDLDDDELEAINNTGQATEGGDAGQNTGKEAADTKQTKSVRMNAPAGADDNEDGPKKAKAAGGKGSLAAAAAGAASAAGGKKKPVKTGWQRVSKFLFGWMRTTFKVNGKKLLPYTPFLWKYMLPLLLWVAGVIIIFGVSFQKLQGLQAPLASLNAAAHVRYRFARCRVMANIYGFSTDHAVVAQYRALLREELALMKAEYDALLYGGVVTTVAPDLSFDPHTPAAAFANEDFSQIFFKTTACLRADQSGCFPETSPWYGVTHSGLDAMVVRYIDEMTTFANAPDEKALLDHPSYVYVTNVGSNDMYDGLTTAAGLFTSYMITRFEEVKQLHIILLAVSLVLILGFVLKMFRPYVRRLHAESKALAGMMSLLPAEVDIESHVKTIVLGLSKDRAGGSMRSASMQLEQQPPGGGPGGFRAGGPGGMMGGPGAMRLLPAPPGGPAGAGWFGGRGQGGGGMMMMGPGGGGGEYGGPPGGGWGGGGGMDGPPPRGGGHWA